MKKMGKPTLKQIQTGERVLDLVDAKVPFKYIPTRDHIWGSKSKAKDLFGHCVQEHAILSMPGVIDCRFYKTIAYVIFKNNPNLAVRYTPSKDGKEVAEINDKHGKKALLKLLETPKELWLEVPRRNRSLEYLRSDEMKEIRRESRERSDGSRPYDSPSKRGFRNGSGQGRAHMWKIV